MVATTPATASTHINAVTEIMRLPPQPSPLPPAMLPVFSVPALQPSCPTGHLRGYRPHV
ncbi:hypothetical protein GCM10010324_30920 [Streptomyces hiroshimensis]|uniref:Uncharacterized protein n=1 Tax=Streptomyces hiroshimensis TaxID=66424 RepID=A0ABQ2YIS4_9ACTN|nr:hypothetical protein GCM10010324_30920 [Streptomyces hiroshimensis]